MKSRITERGSTLHIVVIVVGVIALLGLLGFVFWQNFMNKPAKTSDTTTSTTTTQESEESISQTLSVTEWAVKGSYKSEFTIGYNLDQSDVISVRAPSQRSGCEALGSVSRGTANDDSDVGSTGDSKTNKEAYDLGYGTARAQVGDYYYLYTGPQAACDDSANQNKAIDAVKEFVTSLSAE